MKQAKEQRRKANACQALDASRRAQSDAVRSLHDDQAKAAKDHDPNKAADATRRYNERMNRARSKAQKAQSRLSKPLS